MYRKMKNIMMKKQYKYDLEKGSKKYICPQCGRKSFTRYIDTDTGSHISEDVGRCDHETSCKYHNPPTGNKQVSTHAQVSKKTPVNIPPGILADTLSSNEKNSFLHNSPFKAEKIKQAARLYKIGMHKGYATFPFINAKGDCRAIQMKKFGKSNHTTKTGFIHAFNKDASWYKEYDEQDSLKVSCLFGEHLLKQYPDKIIGLVEAPKTAIYCTAYFGMPSESDYLWLAVFNKSGYKDYRVNVLQGRDIVVYPDATIDGSTFNEWKAKNDEFNLQIKDAVFYTNDILEKAITPGQKAKGFDLADWIELQF